MRRNIKVCDFSVMATTDSSIYVVNTTHIHLPKTTKGYEARLITAISSGLLGLGLLFQIKAHQTGAQVIRNQCILEQISRANTIATAAYDPAGAAMTLLGVIEVIH